MHSPVGTRGSRVPHYRRMAAHDLPMQCTARDAGIASANSSTSPVGTIRLKTTEGL